MDGSHKVNLEKLEAIILKMTEEENHRQEMIKWRNQNSFIIGYEKEKFNLEQAYNYWMERE